MVDFNINNKRFCNVTSLAIYFRLLTVKSSGKSAARRQLELGSLLHLSQDNDDELLDLCSGKFSGGKFSKSPSSQPS